MKHFLDFDVENRLFVFIQGFNRHTAISRAIYFCLFSSCLLVISKLKIYPWHLNLFGITFSNLLVCNTIYNFLSIILLCLPLLFLFGLLPQCSTFLLCILENFDMHLFGGTAMINIPGALYSFLLSIVTWICLSIIGYYGLMIETSKVSHSFFGIVFMSNVRSSRRVCRASFFRFIVV